MVAPYRSVQIGHTRMVHFRKLRIFSLEPVMLSKVILYCLCSVVSAEDLSRQLLSRFSQKPVHGLRLDTVKYEILRILASAELLQVFPQWVVSALELQQFLPANTVFAEKIKFNTLWHEPQMLDPQCRGSDGIGLVLLLLVTNPHCKIINEVCNRS